MSIFFLFVFFVYGGVHVYVFLRAQRVFALGTAASIALALFMGFMVFALFLVRTLERFEYETLARAYAYLAFFWLAVLFLFFCGSFAIDVINLCVRCAGWIGRVAISDYLISNRFSFLISLGLSLVICGYGYFEAKDIGTERIRIETTKLPAGVDHVTIAQVSDVHLGLIIRCERLEKMLALVKEAKPDIFISTGDLVDAQINHLTGLSELLQEIKTPYGNYAIMGNHEYFAGIDKAIAFTKRSGFRVLRNDVAEAGPVTLVGVDDRTGVMLRLEKPFSEKELLARAPKGRFTIYLKHQPKIDLSTAGMFDLQMSGHTHKGQIFPFSLVTRLFFPYLSGTYDLGSGSLLHISRGTGTWGPPVRFLAPPEVTIYEIVRKTAV